MPRTLKPPASGNISDRSVDFTTITVLRGDFCPPHLSVVQLRCGV
jgi:hypothetical protein